MIDSSSDRFINYNDGDYELSGDKLLKWMEYTPAKDEKGISYERLYKFGSYLN